MTPREIAVVSRISSRKFDYFINFSLTITENLSRNPLGDFGLRRQ